MVATGFTAEDSATDGGSSIPPGNVPLYSDLTVAVFFSFLLPVYRRNIQDTSYDLLTQCLIVAYFGILKKDETYGISSFLVPLAGSRYVELFLQSDPTEGMLYSDFSR